MTDLRTAAQQALEALEKLVVGSEYEEAVEAEQAIDALKAALAEPVQEPDPGEYHGWVLREVLFEKGEPVGHREPVQEPVAFAHINGTSDTKWHPPKRKPLTDEEIRDLWSWAMTAEAERTATTQQHAFARAVERAHGIGGAPEERNFCPRCGKRTNDIHTCTPP